MRSLIITDRASKFLTTMGAIGEAKRKVEELEADLFGFQLHEVQAARMFDQPGGGTVGRGGEPPKHGHRMTTPGSICNRADWPNGAETPPRADEIKLCSSFLNSQIALVAPELILMRETPPGCSRARSDALEPAGQ